MNTAYKSVDDYFQCDSASDYAWYCWLYQHGSLINALLAIVAVAFTTRLLTGRASSFSSQKNEIREPPKVPYWFPFLGHGLQMVFGVESFLKKLARQYQGGAFTLNVFGARIHYLYDPEMIRTFLHVSPSQASFESIQHKVILNAFGFPKYELPIFKQMFPEWTACYKHLQTDPGLAKLIRRTILNAKESAKDLVTGNESEVDQMPWERVSRLGLTTDSDGERIVEADFLALIRDFIGHNAIPPLIGSNFLENYPQYLADLWNFDDGFLLMVSGLPRWFPIPSLTRGHIARRKIMTYLMGFHEALEKEANGEDAGPTWPNLDDVGDVIRARAEVYRKHNLSIRGRAALDSSLLWAANANSNLLVFWMLIHIYSDKSLLESIKSEIAASVVVVQPRQELAIPEPPRFETLNVEQLCSKAPLLKSVYLECLRMHSSGQSPKVIQQDLVLRAREKDARGWFINKGTWCFAAYGLHQSDPSYFDSPNELRLNRHLQINKEGQQVARNDSMTPYGGGSSMCKGRAFALQKVMTFAAIIISLWDIEPAGGPEWHIPSHRTGTAVFGVQRDIRVCLKQRRPDPEKVDNDYDRN